MLLHDPFDQTQGTRDKCNANTVKFQMPFRSLCDNCLKITALLQSSLFNKQDPSACSCGGFLFARQAPSGGGYAGFVTGQRTKMAGKVL